MSSSTKSTSGAALATDLRIVAKSTVAAGHLKVIQDLSIIAMSTGAAAILTALGVWIGRNNPAFADFRMLGTVVMMLLVAIAAATIFSTDYVRPPAGTADPLTHKHKELLQISGITLLVLVALTIFGEMGLMVREGMASPTKPEYMTAAVVAISLAAIGIAAFMFDELEKKSLHAASAGVPTHPHNGADSGDPQSLHARVGLSLAPVRCQ